jgi:drug/metabolite transporter (DMT)-like permease
MLIVFLFYAIFSSTYTIGKAALSYSQPIFFIGMRFAIGGLLTLLYLYFFDRKSFTLWPKFNRWAFAQVALIQIFFAYVLEYWSMQYVASSKVALFFSMTPFFTVLFSQILLGEKMTRKKTLGLVIGFMGMIVLMVFNASASESAVGSFSGISLPEIALFIAVIAYAYGWVVKRSMVTTHEISPLAVNGITTFYGGLLTLLVSPFIDTWNPGPVSQVGPFIPLMVAMIVIGNLFGFNVYTWLLKRYSATFVSFAGFTDSLYAALYGWFFLGEQIGSIFFVSFAIITVGLYIFYQEELRQASVSQ